VNAGRYSVDRGSLTTVEAGGPLDTDWEPGGEYGEFDSRPGYCCVFGGEGGGRAAIYSLYSTQKGARTLVPELPYSIYSAQKGVRTLRPDISAKAFGIWGDPMNLGNGFAYVGNNPMTLADPLRRAWLDWIGGIGTRARQAVGAIAQAGRSASGRPRGSSPRPSIPPRIWEWENDPLRFDWSGARAEPWSVCDLPREYWPK